MIWLHLHYHVIYNFKKKINAFNWFIFSYFKHSKNLLVKLLNSYKCLIENLKKKLLKVLYSESLLFSKNIWNLNFGLIFNKI